jgi:hypothetical protein
MIFNVSAIAEQVSKGNRYSYTRIKNIFNGFPGRSKKRDIQEIRQILQSEYIAMDERLAEMEKNIE